MLLRTSLLAGAAALFWTTPVTAQHMDMPGMTMPMPVKKAPAKKPAPKKVAPKAKPAGKAPAKKASPSAAPHSDPGAKPMHHDAEQAPDAPQAQPMQMPMDQPDMHMPMPAQPSPDAQMPMDHSQMGQKNMSMAGHGEHPMAMPAALGSYPATRESSGTAWQPDSSRHEGLMTMSGGWMLMAHGTLNAVYDHQSGPRGDDKAFISGMLMGMASHPIGNGTVQFRAMLAPDPLMGKRGYSLLLATGETANGVDPLVDRQHPHDLFMELSASVSQNFGSKGSIFL